MKRPRRRAHTDVFARPGSLYWWAQLDNEKFPRNTRVRISGHTTSARLLSKAEACVVFTKWLLEHAEKDHARAVAARDEALRDLEADTQRRAQLARGELHKTKLLLLLPLLQSLMELF